MSKEKDFKGLDLADLSTQSHDSSTLSILHPVTGEPVGLEITLASPDSAHYRKVEQQVKDRNLRLVRKSRSGTLSAAALEAGATDILVGAVLSWEGAKWGGTELECNEQNVRQVYESLPFIREQVDEYLGDRANFFGN